MAGLYLHIPNLLSISSRSLFTTTAFINALCTEISFYGETQGKEERIHTICLGGHPASIPLDATQTIIESIIQAFSIEHLEEFSAVVDPGAQSSPDLLGLQALGISRICMPIAFPLTGRKDATDEDTIRNLVRAARQAGFEKIDAILQFEPDEAPATAWKDGLSAISAYGFSHVALQNDEDADDRQLPDQLARFLTYPMTNGDGAACYQHTIDLLTDQGYEHTTLSSFSRPGHASIFEQLYLQHLNYLGVGPTAHSFWWNGNSHQQATRWANVHNLEHYKALLNQRQLPLEARSRVSQDTLADEYMLFHLRTQEGINLEYLEVNFGVDLLVEQVDALAWLESEGYIHPIRNSRVRLTEKGMMHCPTVTHRLVRNRL